MPTLEEIGVYCARARRRKKLRQYQVAQMTNYSESTISMFERGKINNARLFMWYVENILTDEDKIEMGMVYKVYYTVEEVGR